MARRSKSTTKRGATSKAKPKAASKAKAKPATPLQVLRPRARPRPLRWLLKWIWRLSLAAVVFGALALLAFRFLNPPTTPYMLSERARLGEIDQVWVPMERIAPVMARSAVAAEDANFCLHWGIDVDAVRAALEDGGARGGSTISQQVVKNVYLWHGRSYWRKGLEALITPAMEAVWTKRRILEVYLNVAEFSEGVFGIEAAAQHYFGVAPADLTATQAARLAAILPAPKSRSASNPSSFVRNRARAIRAGAATIQADGRAACFETAS
ncbi:monofunctional biosynthetic peptidoglycan transglycosylase [Primorskyibacter sp. S187A]|uniref:monofunctional biosynthetic peptidoglycan transglycosylase n=1 Tax=Primorskyibacter sp. S187A TaxID=3415130 RepID=UPI003C7C701B